MARRVQARAAGGARVESGASFMNSASGRWAGERLLKALQAGIPLTADLLRTADTLQKDEWVEFDEALVQEGVIRLRAVADLQAAGLVRPVAGSLGKTVFEYQKIGDMEPAETSMSGLAATEDDRQEFSSANLPLPITHKDFSIDLRHLSASRNRGESMDTVQARTAGRLVTEQLEYMLFNGGPTYGAVPIYGYLNHPNRNLVTFTGATWSDPGTDGSEILADVLKLIAAQEADRFNTGPYMIYVPSAYSTKLEDDFKANSDKTIRQRILEVDRVAGVKVCDQMAADKVVMVQMTSDVVQWIQGEQLQTIQWDVLGGFRINFKAFTIGVPLVRSAPNHTTPSAPRCGVTVLQA